MFSSDKLDTSAAQALISLAFLALAKILISEKKHQIVPAVVCINGLTVILWFEVVSQGILAGYRVFPSPLAFSPALDNQCLRSRIAKFRCLSAVK